MDMEDWVTENAALIMEAARPFIGMGMEYDDLSQEAMLAACCAYRKYDKTRKWSMSSWVYYNVRHHLLKKLGEEAQYRLNVMADDTAVVASLQQMNRCFENWDSPTEDIALRHLLWDEIIKFRDEKLKPKERMALDSILTEVKGKEAAETQKVHRITTIRRKKKVRHILSERFSSWLDMVAIG